MSFASKFKVVTLQRQNVTFFGFRDPEDQEIRIVLPPSAEGMGLNPAFFRNLLLRPGMEDVKELVTYETFHPSQFDLTHQDDASNQPRKRGDRSQKYACLPVTEVEVILNRINLNKIRDTFTRENLAVFQKCVNSLIRKFYNEGGAVNEEATPEQKKTLREKLKETQDENAELREENSDLRSDVKDLVNMMRKQSRRLEEQSTAINGLVSTVSILQKDVSELKTNLKKETQNRTAAVARENKERKGRWKAEHINRAYEKHMTSGGFRFSSVKKKAIKEFEENFDANW